EKLILLIALRHLERQFGDRAICVFTRRTAKCQGGAAFRVVTFANRNGIRADRIGRKLADLEGNLVKSEEAVIIFSNRDIKSISLDVLPVKINDHGKRRI